MKAMTMLVLGVTLVGSSTMAFASTKKHTEHGAPQGHHCILKGAEVQKSKTNCKNAGGTWEKKETAAVAKPATAPAEPAK